MWAWGSGYLTSPNNSVSTDPSYDPYQGGASNYVSTDPTYNPYGYDSGSSAFSSPNMWGALIKGIGGYAQSQSDADASAEQAKLSAKAKLELAQQQRGYELDDRASKQGAVSKWSKYFGG
jgi:hypothetical protein